MSDQNREKSISTGIIILFQGIVVILSIAIGYFGHNIIHRYQGDLALLQEARHLLVENTIHEIPQDPALEYGMIKGMLGIMDDPYTNFVEPPAHQVLTDELAGRYSGVGVRLERDTQADWRLYPMPDSPAITAGIQDGDLLLGVDDLPVTPQLDEMTLMAAMRGPEGETVKLTIQREAEQRTISIQRQFVPLPSVTWNILPDTAHIGILRVNRIAETTAAEMQTGIDTMLDGGAEALIIDLRDNGGGLVEAGVEIAELFLGSGMVIQQHSKGETTKTFEVSLPGPYPDIPLVLLINANTASSAEIVAGALKAHERAELVGTSTHGKTSIQLIFELSDGASVHVTSGHWSIPGLTFPLLPDHTVLDDPDGIEFLRTAVTVLGSQ